MRVCFPVAHNRGTETSVYPHFGSAPMYLVIDTANDAIADLSPRHVGSAEPCEPLELLAGQRVDAIVVSGIGPGALSRLRSLGVAVYHASGGTIRDALAEMSHGTLPVIVGDDVLPPGLCGTIGHGRHHAGCEEGCNGDER